MKPQRKRRAAKVNANNANQHVPVASSSGIQNRKSIKPAKVAKRRNTTSCVINTENEDVVRPNMKRRKSVTFADEVELFIFDPLNTQQNDDKSQASPQPAKEMNNNNTNMFFQKHTNIPFSARGPRLSSTSEIATAIAHDTLNLADEPTMADEPLDLTVKKQTNIQFDPTVNLVPENSSTVPAKKIVQRRPSVATGIILSLLGRFDAMKNNNLNESTQVPSVNPELKQHATYKRKKCADPSLVPERSLLLDNGFDRVDDFFGKISYDD